MKKLISMVLAASFLVYGCSTAPNLTDSATQPVRVVFATDLHYISQSLTDNGENFVARLKGGDGKVTQYIDPIVDAFFEELATSPPDALVLGGDLTFNGAKQSHEDLATKLKALEQMGVPVVLLPGNHDTDNFMAGSYFGGEFTTVDSVSDKEFWRIYNDFGPKQAAARDKSSGSYLYKLRSDLWLLMLDVNTGEKFNAISDSTYNWLEQQLEAAKASGARVISVSHQNLRIHNPQLYSGYIIDDNDRINELFERYDVLCNLSGHIHLQHISDDAVFPEIVTSSMAISPIQYGLLTYNSEKLTYSTQSVGVSGLAVRNGSDDQNLLDFDEYARRFFWDGAFERAEWDLVDDGIKPEKAASMARFYADVNLGYFRGVAPTRSRTEPEWALWELYEKDNFRYSYIETMLDSGARGHNEFVIEVAASTTG